MVILSADPMQMEVKNLHTLKVEQLLLRGKPYQKIADHPIGQILKGMVRK